MNKLSEIGLESLVRHRKKRDKKTNKHHREAVANGGTNYDGNLIRVPKKAHAFYHAFFGVRTPLQIGQYLNRFWLPLRVTLIAIPTEHVSVVLEELKRREILDSCNPEDYGVTKDHLRFCGTKAEQEMFAPEWEKRKRPE